MKTGWSFQSCWTSTALSSHTIAKYFKCKDFIYQVIPCVSQNETSEAVVKICLPHLYFFNYMQHSVFILDLKLIKLDSIQVASIKEFDFDSVRNHDLPHTHSINSTNNILPCSAYPWTAWTDNRHIHNINKIRPRFDGPRSIRHQPVGDWLRQNKNYNFRNRFSVSSSSSPTLAPSINSKHLHFYTPITIPAFQTIR